jgi:hypothetical protein
MREYLLQVLSACRRNIRLFSFGFAAEAHEKTLTNNAAYLVKLYL